MKIIYRARESRWGSIIKVHLVFVMVILLLAGCASRKKEVVVDTSISAEKLYTRAVTAYQSVLYEDSLAFLKVLIEDHPLTEYAVNAQLMLADIYYTQEEYEDAASSYASFVRLHPGHKKSPYASFKRV